MIVQELEQRHLLAGEAFDGVKDLLRQQVDQVQTSLLETSAFKHDLPGVGAKLRESNDLLDKVFEKLNNVNDETASATELVNSFNSVFGPGSASEVSPREIALALSDVATVSINTFDLGIDVLSFSGNANFNVDLSYTLHFTVGTDAANLATATPADLFVDVETANDELQLDLSVRDIDLPSFSGVLGPLQASASQQGTGDALDLEFTIDLGSNSADPAKVRLNEASQLTAAAKVQGNVSIEYDLELAFQALTQTRFNPRLTSDFEFIWTFDAGTDAGGAITAFGNSPTARFNDVTLDLGKVISELGGEMSERVLSEAQPLFALAKQLNDPIPGLAALSDQIKGFVGDADSGIEPLDQALDFIREPSVVNFIDVGSNLLTDPDEKAAAQTTADIIRRVNDLGQIATLLKSQNDLSINFGSFQIGGSTSDLRIDTGDLADVDIDASPRPGVSDDASSLVNAVQDPDGDGQSDVTFPILDNPTSAFRMLLGQEVSLVEYEFDYLVSEAYSVEFYSQNFLIGVVPANFQVGFVLSKMNLGLTLGLTSAAFSGSPDRGIFVGAGESNPLLDIEARLTADFSIGADFDLAEARAGVRASIDAKGDIYLADPTATGRVALADLAAKPLQGSGEMVPQVSLFSQIGVNFSLESLEALIETVIANNPAVFITQELATAVLDFAEDQGITLPPEVREFIDDPTFDNAEAFYGAFVDEIPVSDEFREFAKNPGEALGQFVGNSIDTIVENDPTGITNAVACDGLGLCLVGGNIVDEEVALYTGPPIFKFSTGDCAASIVTLDGISGPNANRQMEAPPDLAEVDENGVLRLFVGADANRRNVEPDAIDENFTVRVADPGAPENGQVIVSAFGFQRQYDGVKSIFGDAADGTDVLDAGGVPFPVTFYGGDGADFLVAGTKTSFLSGESGADTLTGSPEDDRLFGGDDRDILIGAGGDDQLFGGSGNDDLFGDFRPGSLEDKSADPASFGDDRILAGEGDDFVYAGPGNDEVSGEDGNDFIRGGDGNDFIDAGRGQDTAHGDQGDDYIIAGPSDELSSNYLTGGLDNDELIGAGGSDLLLGNSGQDYLVGLGGTDVIRGGADNDTLLGGDENDVLEGGQGLDQIYGGNDSDNFIWSTGDESDVMEGGNGGSDVLVVLSNETAETFNAFARLQNPVRSVVSSTLDDVELDLANIEKIDISASANDRLVVGRANDGDLGSELPSGVNFTDPTASLSPLHTTSIRSIDFRGAEDGEELLFVDGLAEDDTIFASLENATDSTVRIEGLGYTVRMLGAQTADGLIIRGNEGNDHVSSGNPQNAGALQLESAIGVTFAGGAGNDQLVADAILIGGSGDDLLQGGAGDDMLFGNDGQDTLIGGDGADFIHGGEDFDTILISGTPGNDVIDVFQAAPDELQHTVNGDIQVDELEPGSVEEVRIVAGAGADLIRVNWLDAHGINEPIDALRMTVEGGSDATGDRLVVVDDGEDDLVLYRQGVSSDSGTVQVGPGNAEPLTAVFDGIETVNFVDESGAAIVNDPDGPQLVVFKNDPFETNDDRFIATFLGGGATINVDPTIDPGALVDPFEDGFDLPGDRDFYRLVATKTGILDFQVYFREVGPLASGRPGLPNDGNLDINVRDADGNVITGFGENDDDDDERIRIPAVAGQTYYLEVFGDADAINVYSLSFVNQAPPVPYALELDDNPINGQTNPPGTQNDNSDTGRSQFDNHTYDDTPTLFLRLDDGIFLHDLPGNPEDGNAPDEVIAIPFQAGPEPAGAGYAIAIFDEGNTLPQTGVAPQTPLGFATATGQEGVYTFTVPEEMALSEGSHFLTARVQMIDPAADAQTGFGARSLPFEIVVDRTPPEVAFGLAGVDDDGLHPDSDSGDLFLPGTLTDLITNDLTPTFFGRAEANAVVRVYVDLGEDATPLLIGQTVALPYDGTEQLETPLYPEEPGGQWELTSTISLNDPRIVEELGRDGPRRLFVTAEDVAGNISVIEEELEVMIDTQGPQVDGLFITGREDFNIFTLKPETPEPTPRVDSLTIRVIDFPERIEPFFYSALSNVPPLAPIVLVGDHSGVIAIDTIEYVDINTGPGVAEGEIIMTFSEPLPDDRFTLTLSDNLIDPAGNQLDGENNAAEPIGDPFFPTGDLIPGGDFIARFTVDSRPEIATWSQGVVYADINGNFVWDPEGQDNDATNRDFVFNFGEVTDAYFTGNFAHNDFVDPDEVTSSGFDKLGAYGAFNGQYQFFLDTDDDGVGDLVGSMAFQVNAIPVAGNFFFSSEDEAAIKEGLRPRDEIGAFDGHNWYLDVDGNNQIDADEKFPTSLRGIPVVGDFNGDGFDDLATYNNDTGVFTFDLDRDGDADDQLQFGFSGFGERPVAGDVNLDGIDDLVMWVPRQEGQLPKESGEFHFLVSDELFDYPEPSLESQPHLVPPSAVFQPYSPEPLGNDLVAQFGDDFALPLLGNFDPPIDGGGGGASFLGALTNQSNPLDTNNDGDVTALDALVVINALGRGEIDTSVNPLRLVASLGGYRLDASQDGMVSALDALRVINGLGSQEPIQESESEPTGLAGWASVADQAVTDLDDGDDELLDLLAADSSQIF